MKIDSLFTLKGFTAADTLSRSGPEQTTSGLEKLNLSPGSLLKARVIDFSADGRVLLEIEGKTVTASSRTALPKGNLLLEVQQGGDNPVLSPAGKQTAVQNFLQSFLGSGTGPHNAVKLLNQMTGLHSSQTGGKTDQSLTNLLRTINAITIDGSGDIGKILQTEAAISPQSATFLPKLLQKFLEEGSGRTEASSLTANESSGLKKLAHILEMLREVNDQPVSGKQSDFSFFPCFFAGDSGWGQWLFRKNEEKGQQKEQDYSLSFFLEMSRIGNLHCQVRVQGQTVQGHFFVDSEKISTHIRQALSELTDLLNNLGYSPVSFSCEFKQTSMMQELKESLQSLAGMEMSIVDLRA